MRRLLVFAFAVLWLIGATPQSPRDQTFSLRGHEQTLRLYGPPDGAPILLSSGDGGWVHLAPQIAVTLAEHGYFIVGFDVRAYLAGFTTSTTALQPNDEPKDYAALARFAQRGGRKPILVGVSEGAALSLLAATDPETKELIAGVIGVGLPDRAELGWRWRDAIIYLTHTLPKEPTFSTADIAGAVAPIPFAAIHSAHDEFVPLADVERVVNSARDPKRLWIIDASNHRFSDKVPEFNARLLEALAWIGEHAPR